VFNPFPGGRFATWTRFLASASDIRRINHRMHNKLFVADDALAITGGRNIGDQYFTRDQHSNFIDLDVVAAGAIVPELSASFDAFWNSKYAYPIASVASPVSAEPSSPPLIDTGTAASANWLERELDSGTVPLTWVPATVLADRPAKIASETSPDEEVTIANDMSTLMRSAKQELIVISPYFVPGKDGMALVRQAGRAKACTSAYSPIRWHPPIHPLVHTATRATACAAQARHRAFRGAAQARTKARALPSVSQFQRQPARQGAGDRPENRVHRFMNMDARSAHSTANWAS
jgi:hypothetical protein